MVTAGPAAASSRAAAGLADRLALAWAVLAAVVVFGCAYGFGFDDPFITYRYAENLARGLGFVYNPGERVLSTTAPFYALTLAPFAAAGLPVPLVSNLIGSLSLGAGALALWRLGRLARLPVAGAVAALLFPLTPGLVLTLGLETVPVIALILWGFVATWAGRPRLAACLLAVATLTRGDAALAVALAGVVTLARGGARPALAFGATVGLVVAPFLLAAWWYFGTPLPATLGAKRSQAAIPGSRSYAVGLVAALWGLRANPLFWPLLALAPPGLGAALWRRGPLALVVAWSLAHSAAYSLLGVNAYFWYYGPAITGLVTAAALGAQLLADGLGGRFGQTAGRGVAAALATAVLIGNLAFLPQVVSHPDVRPAVYREAGLWLRANTPADATVAALEVGAIGFYSRRPMIDFAGLIQPELGQVFAAGGGYAEAARVAIARHRPDYLVHHEHAFPLVSADQALAAACVEQVAIPYPGTPDPLRIYRCRWQ